MDTLIQDLRFALRTMMKRPLVTFVALATVAVAIGANTAIFSVVRAVLLRPLPFREPGRLVWLWDTNASRNIPRNSTSPAGYAAYRDESGVFEELGGSRDWLVNLTGAGEPESIIGYQFSGNFFRVLGVAPLLGRTFGEDETRPGHDKVAVLQHALWQRRFGGDPGVIGRSISLDGTPYTVIGVMPPDFQHPARVEIWVPMALDAEMAANGRLRFVRIVGRLKAGVSREVAQIAVAGVAGRLGQRFPDSHGGFSARVDPIESRYTGDIKPALLVLLGAVGFVLLIACANMSNLLLARAADRRREIAIRASLGAGRGRLAGQLLTESVMLAAIGGVAGIALAFWGVDALLGLFPSTIANVAIPRMDQIRIDGAVLAFALLLSVATGLLFGMVPALQMSRAALMDALREGGRSSSEGRRSRRFRSSLVVAQFAMAVVLTAGAALMIRSFLRLQGGELGFAPRGITTARLMLPGYKYDTPEKRRAFFVTVLDRVRALPGVEGAASTTFIPLSGWNSARMVEVEGRPAPSPQDRPTAEIRAVDETYFDVMHIPLRRGRGFTTDDRDGTTRVAVVNETFARRVFPGEDPIGRRLTVRLRTTAPGEPPVLQIVGVVGDVRHRGLAEDASPELYFPYLQEPVELLGLIVRTSPGVGLGEGLRKAVWSVDPDQPVLATLPLEQMAAESVTLRRVSTILLGVFAGIALFLAALGIYGVMAHSVSQRTQEFGVRMAVGASAREVVGLVLDEGVRLAALGAVVGVAAALGLGRFIESLLFGVTATDPVSFLAVVAFLTGAALFACWIPARRAARVDPIVALRYE